MPLDSAHFEKYYSELTEEEFSQVRREELSNVARECYDREAEKRSTPEWGAQKAREAIEAEEEDLRRSAKPEHPVLRTFKLLVVLLAIPLVGYGVLGAVNNSQEREWREALQKKWPEMTQNQLDGSTLKRVCAVPDLASKLEDICSSYDLRQTLRDIALWTGIVSLIIVLLITISGFVCQTNRYLLLIIFKPGLYLTNLSVSIGVVLQAAILIAVLYYGESTTIGRVHFGFILAIGVAALVGALSIVIATFRLIKKARTVVVGKVLTPTDHPRIWSFVSELASVVGTEPPDNLVVGLDPNFFVTEADVRCVDGDLIGRTMYLSVPLCRILTMGQLRGIIAHELGHFEGFDTRFSLRFYPIYRGAIESQQSVTEAASDYGTSSLVLLPSLFMLDFFLDRFSSAEKKISRQRELAADSVASSIVGKNDFATGLVKIMAFAGIWPQLTTVMQQSLKRGTLTFDGKEYNAEEFFSNISNIFVYMAASSATPEVLEGLDEKIISHPTDSHPPLSIRLKAAGTTLQEIGHGALDISPEPPASDLIDNLEELECLLSVAEQVILNPDRLTESPSSPN